MDIDLTQITLGQALIYISGFFLISSLLIKFVQIFKKVIINILSTLNLYHKKVSEKEAFYNTVEKHTTDIEQINSKIDTLASTLNDYIEDTKLNNQTLLRSGLLNIYHEVRNKGYILDCELDAFSETMERYEKCGGDGKVHTIIHPYIQTIASTKMYQSDIDAEAHYNKFGSY